MTDYKSVELARAIRREHESGERNHSPGVMKLVNDLDPPPPKLPDVRLFAKELESFAGRMDLLASFASRHPGGILKLARAVLRPLAADDKIRDELLAANQQWAGDYKLLSEECQAAKTECDELRNRLEISRGYVRNQVDANKRLETQHADMLQRIAGLEVECDELRRKLDESECTLGDEEAAHQDTLRQRDELRSAVEQAKTAEADCAELRAKVVTLSRAKLLAERVEAERDELWAANEANNRMIDALRKQRNKLQAELAAAKRLAPLCAEHGKDNGGSRASCLVCACIEKDAALSKIDYVLGEPNDMGVSLYDTDYSTERVITKVESLAARVELYVYCSSCGKESLAEEEIDDDVCPKCGRDGCLSEVRTRVRAASDPPMSQIPCCRCGGPVVEFTVPNEIWNRVIRKGGPETDQEYLCIGCFAETLLSDPKPPMPMTLVERCIVAVEELYGFYGRDERRNAGDIEDLLTDLKAASCSQSTMRHTQERGE